jgi:biopolymer transport protein ExbB
VLLRTAILSILLFLCFGVPLAFSAQGFEYSLDADTLALWHMNEGEGDKVIDESAKHYKSKIDGVASWGDEGWKKEGKPGKSFIFDGTTVINLGNVKELITPDAITIEAWVYPKNLGGWKLICANWSGAPGSYHLACDNSVPKLHVTTDKGSANADSPKPLQVEKWYHIAGSYDSKNGDINLYIDGDKVATKNLGGKMIDNPFDVVIGGKHEKFYPWNGMMDEVRISKIARDPKDMSPNLSGPQAVNPSESLTTTWGKIK